VADGADLLHLVGEQLVAAACLERGCVQKVPSQHPTDISDEFCALRIQTAISAMMSFDAQLGLTGLFPALHS
jgi:hypothetical protein